MSTPNKIRVNGQIYVKVEAVTSHEKCPSGSHWNEKHHKCEKLPENLRRMRHHANALSKEANGYKPALGLHPAKAKNIHRHLHKAAAKAHHIVQGLAKRHGFQNLAKQHSKKKYDHAKQIVSLMA